MTTGSRKIHIDLDSQQELIVASALTSDYCSYIEAHIKYIIQTIPSLATSGYFSSKIGGTATAAAENDGLARFLLKAQEFYTLSEVLSQHVANTYSSMEGADFAMAAYIAHAALHSPTIDQETETFILENPEAAVDIYHGRLNGEPVADDTEEGGQG